MIDSARIGGSTPSYLHGLSLIGQYLNQQRARSVTVAEVDTGFLLHFFPEGDWRKVKSVAVQHTDLLELSGPFNGGSSGGKKGVLIRGGDHRDKRHPLFPMGYDTFFRMLGHKLDRRTATGLTICETHDKVYVNFWLNKATFVIRDQRRQAVSSVQMDTYDGKAIRRLIDHTQGGIASEALRYDQGMKMNVHDHISTLAMAFILENDGNYHDAEMLLHRIVSQVPAHPEAHYHLARLAISKGDRRGALDAIRRAIRIRDDLAALHDLHGRVLRQMNKHKDAVPAFEEAVRLDPEHGIYHAHLARAYEAVGRKDNAATELALSASQHAAPAWDMVQEEMSVESQVPNRLADLAGQLLEQSPAEAALLPALHDTPAAAALLPPLPKEEPGDQPEIYQADWGASVARAERQGDVQEASSTPPGAPPLTTFDAPPVPWPQAMPPAAQAAPGWPQAQPAQTPSPQQAAPAWNQAPEAQPPPAVAAQAWPSAPAAPGWPQTHVAPTWPQAQPPQAATAAPAWPPAQAQPAPPAQAAAYAPPNAAAPGWPPGAAASTIPAQAVHTVQMPVEQAPHFQALEERLRTDPFTPQAAPVQPGLAAPSIPVEQAQGAPAAVGGGVGSQSPSSILPADAAAPAAPRDVSAQGGDAATGAVEIAAEIMMIQRALEAEPNRADLHRKLGFLLARQGKTAEAATEFRKALQCSRTNL